MTCPLVSVIIPTYNRCKMISDCIDSVVASDYSNIEVIVVDDASPEPGINKVCETRWSDSSRKIKYFRNEVNLLTAGSRNVGLAQATGVYVLFLDNDNIIAVDMISKLEALLRIDTQMGIVGALSIHARDNAIWTLGASYNLVTSRPVNLHEGKTVESINPSGCYPTFYSPNAMMLRRSVALDVNGFDVRYGMMYEEADFGYRISKAGYHSVICADARTSHVGLIGRKEDPLLRRLGVESALRAYCFARNRTIFMRRFAPKRNMILYYLFFVHAFSAYYCAIAIWCRRFDIAKAYFTGTFAGFFGKH